MVEQELRRLFVQTVSQQAPLSGIRDFFTALAEFERWYAEYKALAKPPTKRRVKW